MKKLLQLVSVFVLVVLSNTAYSQFIFIPTPAYLPKKAMYVDHANFENKYENGQDMNVLARSFNLLFVALLDSDYRDEILAYSPAMKGEYNYYREMIDKKASFKMIDTEATTMKDVFFTSKYKNSMLDAIYGDDGVLVDVAGSHFSEDKAIVIISSVSGGDICLYYFEKRDSKLIVMRLDEELMLNYDRERAIIRDEHRLGIRAGLAISNLTEFSGVGDDRARYIFDYNTNISLGLVYGISLDRQNGYYLEPGLYYNSIGGQDADIKFKFDYITVPILFGQRFPIGKGNTFEAQYGFYLSQAIGGSAEVTEGGVTTNLKVFSDESNSYRFNSFDSGIVLGLSVTINRIHIGYRLNMGLNNLAKGSVIESALGEGYSLRNGWNTFSIGYNF